MKKEILKMLRGASLPEGAAESLTEQITDLIGRVTVPKWEFNAKATQVKELEENLRRTKETSEALKVDADRVQTIKRQSDCLHKRYDADIAWLKADNRSLMFQCQLNDALAKAGVRDPDTVRMLLDRNRISLSDQGTIIGLDPQLKLLKKTDGYLFYPHAVKRGHSRVRPAVKYAKGGRRCIARNKKSNSNGW